jgi:hypothetical protein
LIIPHNTAGAERPGQPVAAQRRRPLHEDLPLASVPGLPRHQRDDTCGRLGGRRLHRRVDRDQSVQPCGLQHLPHVLGTDGHPQLRAVPQGALVGLSQRMSATTIAANRRGQIRDQHGGAVVDQPQQLLAHRPAIRRADALGQRHDRLRSRPRHRVTVLSHGGPGIRQDQGAAHRWHRR